jgi:23S rRNA pseudouridine2605 synthase
MEMRLSKYLATAGVASRRACDKLIEDGRVKVNGEVTLTAFTRVSKQDVITVDDVAIQGIDRKYYIVLNKPRGYVCTSKDVHAKKLAVDLIDLPTRLYSVGRLDKDSEGMILFTNDGDFAQKVGHPSYRVTKKYHVTINNHFRARDKVILENGLKDQGEFLKPDRVDFVRSTPNGNVVVEFVLTEGKNREIRRLCAKMDWQVRRLERVAIGKIKLDRLKSGSWRELSTKEVSILKSKPL